MKKIFYSLLFFSKNSIPLQPEFLKIPNFKIQSFNDFGILNQEFWNFKKQVASSAA
jgi:hypothetical protein